jgi:molecular chaperone DnaK (HSP70)
MRYIIGIDLGTTNSALSYIDTEHSYLTVQSFSIPQLGGVNRVQSSLTLPSFCYLVLPGEWPEGSLSLPWNSNPTLFAGQFAKKQGARVPTRLIQSAKSWLCNVSANRREKILPVEATDASLRLSPVEASAFYLSHLRDAWNAKMAKGQPSLELEEQEIILTVPASFDEIARSLTVEAARQAGFLHITLLEEPQSAFYSWIAQHEKEWQTLFQGGEAILVCDVGGGTTDFSLIEILEQEGKLTFQRMAVGNHLLLGGDNMDATLAYFIENKIKEQHGVTLDSTQWLRLQAEVRTAKESLLSPINHEEEYKIVLQGTGSSVVKGSLSTTLYSKEVKQLLLDGFFGIYPLEEALRLKVTRGVRTMGLPYEDEPLITKHLAKFLDTAQSTKKEKGVDYILFNGGTLKPDLFRSAIEQSLTFWFPHKKLTRLSGENLDLAVTRGAAYYGKVRRGLGVRIQSGLPCSYYLKIVVENPKGEFSTQALTILSRGAQEEHSFCPEQIFSLHPNKPVAFYLLTSHIRLHDKEGELVEIDPVEMQPLPSIQTILRFGKKILPEKETSLPIRLGIRLTPIGTIDFWLESQVSEHRWDLEFQLRSVTGQEAPHLRAFSNLQDEKFEKGHLDHVTQSIREYFHPHTNPTKIMEQLESQIGKARNEWGPTLLREMWQILLEVASKRKISTAHEARWWNLAGFFLRPGFGFPLDDFRLKEIWKIVLADLKNTRDSEVLIQMWICFRRIAGGLNKGQQMQIATEIFPLVLDKKTGKLGGKHKNELYAYSERIRALAALERIDVSMKIRLGHALVERISQSQGASHEFWALSRIGARHLLHASIGAVIPKDIVVSWIEKLLNSAPTQKENLQFVLTQFARKTDHREINLPDNLIKKIVHAFPSIQSSLKETQISHADQNKIFGDHLPMGLTLKLIEE